MVRRKEWRATNGNQDSDEVLTASDVYHINLNRAHLVAFIGHIVTCKMNHTRFGHSRLHAATYNGIDGPACQRVFDHFVDSGMMPDKVTCKNNGATYDTTWVPANGLWKSHHGMTIMDYVMKNAMYMQQGYVQTSFSTCGSVMVAVWRLPVS